LRAGSREGSPSCHEWTAGGVSGARDRGPVLAVQGGTRNAGGAGGEAARQVLPLRLLSSGTDDACGGAHHRISEHPGERWVRHERVLPVRRCGRCNRSNLVRSVLIRHLNREPGRGSIRILLRTATHVRDAGAATAGPSSETRRTARSFTPSPRRACRRPATTGIETNGDGARQGNRSLAPAGLEPRADPPFVTSLARPRRAAAAGFRVTVMRQVPWLRGLPFVLGRLGLV
jgi:hypothetical protein